MPLNRVTYQYPESSVLHRRIDRAFPLAVRGRGIYLYDESGRRYLDATGGAMVVTLGHGVPEICDAVASQMRQVAYVNGTQFTNKAAEELAAELAEVLPPPLRYSYFLSSGSEAIEASIKLARQYWWEQGKKSKWKIISRRPSYHGNTLTALSVSGREHHRTIYEPLLTQFSFIPAPDSYRHPGCEACTGDALENAILDQGPENVAAFLCEPVGGSSTGASVPANEYLAKVSAICRKYDVLLIADEVLTGMGRTGQWFAFQHFNTTPDILVLGKGLSSGYAPLSAVVTQREILDVIAHSSGKFQHAQTYSHTPVICAAGLATVRYLKAHKLVERCRDMEGFFFETLNGLKKHPAVGDIRGKGLLAGIEFVRDRASREPFERSQRFSDRLLDNAFNKGLILWSNTGHVDGINGDIIMVAPPFTISREEIVELVDLLGESLAEVG